MRSHLSSTFRRSLLVGPVAATVALMILALSAWLVGATNPPAALSEPQAVYLVPHVPHQAPRHHAKGNGVASDLRIRSGPEIPLSHASGPGPGMLLRRGIALAAVRLPSGRLPSRPMAPLTEMAARATREYLGLDNRGHRRHAWVSGAAGLFYLPDSGRRVRQVRYVCPSGRKVGEPGRETVSALVTRSGHVTDVRFIAGNRTDALPALRRAMEQGWRFEPLVLHGKPTAFRLRFTAVVEETSQGIIGYHCQWDKFNRAHRGALTPTWVLYVPDDGLPIAYAYIAPQRLGEPAGGLAPDKTGGREQ